MVTSRLARAASTLQPSTLAVAALLVVALTLRVYNLNWDDGTFLHPDERHIADVIGSRISFDWPPDLDNLVDPGVSRLNPRSNDPDTGEPRDFAYGALPLIVTDIVAEVATGLTDTDWRVFYGPEYKLGRAISALLDTLTVLIVYLIGLRVFGRTVGLVSAAVAAMAPMAIQLAHFFTTDSWLTFFVSLTLLWSIRAAESGQIRWFAAAGAGFGLAMATKGSVFALAGLLAVAVACDVWRRLQDGESPGDALTAAPERCAIAGLAAIGSFALFEPYALLRPTVYLDSLRLQAEIVRGSFDVPFTRQYVGTTPILYQIEQFVRWGFGPVAGILGLLGMLLIVRRLRHRPTVGQVVVLSWLLGYGFVVALPETKFLRYLAPLIPVLALSAGVAFDACVRCAMRHLGRRVAVAVGGTLMAGMALWTVAFSSVYAAENPRLAASRWIFENVPKGATISAEYWDDALPIDLAPGLTRADFQYDTVTIDLYTDGESQVVANQLYQNLEQLDYVIISSNRVMSTIPLSPWRYPVQEQFYKLLTAGRLGFELVADFHRQPGVGRWRIDDQAADESFVNYDHPHVLIFAKRSLIPRETYDQLMSWAISQPVQASRHAEEKSLLLDEPVGELTAVDDARWSDGITSNSFAAIVVWVLLLGALQAAGRPLAGLVFARFADAGWGMSRLVALLLAGYLVWIGSSLELISFRAVWAAVALALVGAIWLVVRAKGSTNLLSFERRRCAIAGEAVFWAVFALLLLLRYLNPDSWHPFWGGEKPMEFAHLNAILRSAHFPPYDPWYSDGYINYYYYGLYLVAFCLKLTGIPSEVAFNLAQPTVIALLASAAFSLTATLGRDLVPRRRLAIPGGLLGVLLVVGIGNLDSFVRIIRALPDRMTPTFLGWTWGGSRVITGAITEFPYFTALYADLHAHVVALPMTVFAVALAYAVAREPRAFALAVSRGGRSSWRWLLTVRLALTALVVGSLAATNAWDVAVYFALLAVAIFMATSSIRSSVARLSITGLLAAAVGGGAYVLFLPFFQHYVTLYGSLARVRSHTALPEFADHLGGLLAIAGCGLVATLLATSGNRSIFAQPMIPASILSALIAARIIATDRANDWVSAISIAIVVVVVAVLLSAAWPTGRDRSVETILLACTALLILLAVIADRLVLGIWLGFASAASVLWLRGNSMTPRFLGAMIAAASLVGAGTEIVFLEDDLASLDLWYRMNTIFKFYNQIWVLLALASAALMINMVGRSKLLDSPTRAFGPVDTKVGIISRLAATARPTMNEATEDVASGLPSTRWSHFGLFVSGLVILASLCYPLSATAPRLNERFSTSLGSGTLNAFDWMEYGAVPVGAQSLSFVDDRAVIAWFNSDVPGSPVIAEASIGPYRCNGSRISIGTGLPTILGWDRHERQQRYPEGIDRRLADVRTLYESPSPEVKLEILRRYNVEYVVVGELERLYPTIMANDCVPGGSAEGIAAFDTMVGTSLEVAFSSGSTVVYRVQPATA